MKRFLIVFVFVFLIIFSGCSGIGSGPGSGSGEVDKSGYGLEVKLDFDDRYIDSKKFIYTLELKNTGLKPVVIDRDNLKLRTIQVKNQRSYFDDESLENFYEKILDGRNSITLVNDQERKVSGILALDDDLDYKLFDRLDIIFSINYEYETLFDNNLRFVYDNGMFELEKLDRISQAAPLQISDVRLAPGDRDDEYILEFYFDDRGKGYFTSDQTGIEIDDIVIEFSGDEISSSCEAVVRKNGNDEITNEFKIKSDQNLYLKCPIILEDQDTFTTKVSGNFKYDYGVELKDSIALPED